MDIKIRTWTSQTREKKSENFLIGLLKKIKEDKSI